MTNTVSEIEKKLAYSVHDFCAATGISRAFLYDLWRQGRGPKRIHIGSRVLISHEAALAWLNQEGSVK